MVLGAQVETVGVKKECHTMLRGFPVWLRLCFGYGKLFRHLRVSHLADMDRRTLDPYAEESEAYDGQL